MSTFGRILDRSALNGTNGFQISGDVADDLPGFSVAFRGEVKGDGFDDLILGSRGAGPDGQGTGARDVFGKASGLGAEAGLSTLGDSDGGRINRDAAADLTGFSVTPAGDVSGGGFSDVMIGVGAKDPNGIVSGANTS